VAFALTSRITLGPYVYDYTHGAEIVSSWKDSGDYCTLTMPRTSLALVPYDDRPALAVGMPVLVELGYNTGTPELVEEFKGYIATIEPGFTVKIRCEDEVFALKRASVSGAWTNKSVATIIEDILNKAKLAMPKASGVTATTLAAHGITLDTTQGLSGTVLSQVTFRDVSAYAALLKLKEATSLASYFRGKSLKFGLPYIEQGLPTEATAFARQRNICKSGFQLVFKRPEDVQLRVKTIYLAAKGKKLEGNAPLPIADSGELRTYHTTKYNSVEQLNAWAARILAQQQYGGYRGSFKAWGQPSVRHSERVTIDDRRYPEIGIGPYVVDSVKKTFSPRQGYRQVIELGPLVSSTTTVTL
jgi:hypothetical protein